MVRRVFSLVSVLGSRMGRLNLGGLAVDRTGGRSPNAADAFSVLR